jgi:hypothetical protein
MNLVKIKRVFLVRRKNNMGGSRREKIVGLFLTLILFIVGGCSPKEKEEGLDEPESYSYVKEENTIEKKSFENGQIVVTKEKKPPKNYTTEQQKRDYELSEPSISYPYVIYEDSKKLYTRGVNLNDHIEMKHFIVKVYKIESDGDIQFYKDIDMKKILENYKKGWVATSFGTVAEISGNYCIVGRVYNNRDGSYHDMYIDLEDEKVVENSTKLSSDYDELKFKKGRIIVDEVTNFVDKLDPWFKKTSSLYRIEIEGGNKKIPDSTLVKKYPEIKKYLQSNEDEIAFIIFPDLNTDVEQIAQWLLPEGENMYDGLVLYGDSSKDGQDHEIRSMEEFLEWYQEKK